MIQLEKELEDYIFKKSSLPGPVNEEIKKEAYQTFDLPQMISGELECSFLKFFIETMQPKRVLEVGTFVGYSALAMSENLPADGELITLEIDEPTLAFAQKFWAKTDHGNKIKPILGEALKTMNELQGTFDLIFIDADKVNYPNYLKKSLELLSEGGVIVVDNVLWSGKVLESDGDQDTEKIKELNNIIEQDNSLTKVLLPIRDGIFLVTKRRTI